MCVLQTIEIMNMLVALILETCSITEDFKYEYFYIAAIQTDVNG